MRTRWARGTREGTRSTAWPVMPPSFPSPARAGGAVHGDRLRNVPRTGGGARCRRRGRRKAGPIEGMRDWQATRVNQLCGECHRTAQDINADDGVSINITQRFQAYGLMKSRCFLKSDDRLSCVTCHDPHRNVETRTAPSPSDLPHLSRSEAGANALPRQSKVRCVGCHMPQREMIPGISMADDFIRVFRGTEPRERSAR